MISSNLKLNSEDHILILGASGLVGQHFIPLLIQQLNSQCVEPRISIVYRNLSSISSLTNRLQYNRITLIHKDFYHPGLYPGSLDPTYVIHMANASARDTYDGLCNDSKYLLLHNSIEWLLPHINSQTKKVLFTSSGVAYGTPHDYTEHNPSVFHHLDSTSSLALGKIVSEHRLASHCESLGISLTIARLFSFISKNLPVDIHYALGNFVCSAIQGEMITIQSDGNDVRSYQHLSDTSSWLYQFLTRTDLPTLLNVGSDHAIKIRDLATLVASLVRPGLPIQILNKNPPSHNNRRPYYVPDLSLSFSLGFRNTITLNDGILELANHIRDVHA